MERTESEAGQNSPEKKVISITSLEEFKATLSVPLVCELQMDGKVTRIPCERLSAHLQAQIDRIWDPRAMSWQMASAEVTPPRQRDASGKEFYDIDSPEYIRKLAEVKATAKALTIYHGVAILRTGKPDLKGRDEIREYIESFLSQTIIELLYGTIAGEGLGGMLERANFTGTSEPEN